MVVALLTFALIPIAQTQLQHALTVQLDFISQHEILVTTWTSVFSLYFVATSNLFVETLSVHSSVIPYRDIIFSVATRVVFFLCRDIQNGVAIRSFFETLSLS